MDIKNMINNIDNEKELKDALLAAIFWGCKMKFLIKEEAKKHEMDNIIQQNRKIKYGSNKSLRCDNSNGIRGEATCN